MSRIAGWSVVLIGLGMAMALPKCAIGADSGAGITTPTVLAPFDPSAPGCAPPSGLARAIGFAQDNKRAFIEGAGYGLAQAASDRGLAFEAVSSDSDPARQAAQVAAFVERHFAAIVVPPVDSVALAPELRKAIGAGTYVATIVPPPATTILNAPQYLTGKVLADKAADYIRNTLGGKADVVLLTQDSLQFLAPRFAAMRDAFKDMPGVNIVADISPNPVSEEGGYAMMKLILEANPTVDVVLGADAVVLGALRALREAGKASPRQFIGGIDGEPDAIAELGQPDSPYKTTVALSSPVFGYALSSFAADWLAGKSVPQALDALPIALTPQNIAAYSADQKNPGAVFASPERLAAYVKAYGSICFTSRAQFLDFAWSSEARPGG